MIPEHPRSGPSQGAPVFGRRLTLRAFWCGVAVNAAEAALNLRFYLAIRTLPRGSYGRPMALAGLFFLVGLWGIGVGLPLAVYDGTEAFLQRNRRVFWLSVAGFILCLIAIPVCMAEFQWAVHTTGFILED